MRQVWRFLIAQYYRSTGLLAGFSETVISTNLVLEIKPSDTFDVQARLASSQLTCLISLRRIIERCKQLIFQYVYKPTKCTKILLIRLYFSIYALHVSDCISASSGTIFYKLYVVFSIRAHVWPDVGYRRIPNTMYSL